MSEIFHSNHETPALRKEICAGVFFVDLDETFLNGTVASMTDEELANADCIESTIALISQAKNLNIPVVMVTRNNDQLIERLFAIRPELRVYFDDIIPCPAGRKSEPIKKYLEEKRISPKRAVFLDDTSGERDDVAMNVEGAMAFHPDSISGITFKHVHPDIDEIKKRQLIEKVLVLHDLNRRKSIKSRLKPLFFPEADDIYLAA
jgi:hypothetical protein